MGQKRCWTSFWTGEKVTEGKDAPAFPSCHTILRRKHVKGFRTCYPKIYHFVILIILG